MPRSSKKPSKKDKKPEHEIIKLKDGWEKIRKVGVEPFFERLENADHEDPDDQAGIPQQQYITTYDTIFTMCIQREPHNFSSPLYTKHSEALVEHYKKRFIPALKKAKESLGYEYLKEWVKRWRINKWSVDGMTRMFMYLDRFHVPNSEDLLNTSEQGYTLFRQHVFEDFRESARNAILDLIRREREKDVVDRELLRDSIAVFTELGSRLKKVELQIYREDFHKDLVKQSSEYYRQKSRGWMDQQSCPEYLIQAESCIVSELDRLVAYIDKSSKEGLMEAVRNELLKVHQKELLAKDSGINKMLERTHGPDSEKAKEDLSRLYELYEEVKPDGLSNISDAMKQYICDLGNKYIKASKENKDENKGHTLIRQLIDLHDRFLNIVKTNFHGDQLFHKALKEAFEDFINKEYYTSALLARYANDILKKGTKVQVDDLENTMDHVVMLYGYIRDKDVFERDYQQFLAGRLLQDLSQSEQSERSMIGKLKNECGYHWTSKLEDMFKDIQRSKDIMLEFNQTYGDKFDIEMNVSVCTTGAWPSSSILPINKPMELGPIAERFQDFYLNKYSGRKLNYQWDKGRADVQVKFNPKTKKILAVSTYQMLILLQFNNKTTLTFKQILDGTGIPREDCMVHLLSMIHPKVKVLRKNPNTRELADDHKIQIHPKYSNPRAKIPIPILRNLVKSNVDPNKDPMKPILVLRRHQMDAAIVRIMKARKTLKHGELITEVVKQLVARFKPKPLDIKKRIQNLIELEYLERDENDRQLYHYRQ